MKLRAPFRFVANLCLQRTGSLFSSIVRRQRTLLHRATEDDGSNAGHVAGDIVLGDCSVNLEHVKFPFIPRACSQHETPSN